MGIGIASAYGANALSDSLDKSLRQQVVDRLNAEAIQRQEAQQKFTNDRLTANDARQAEEHAATMQSLSDQREGAAKDRATGLALKLGDTVPSGQEIQKDAPIVQPLQSVGLLRGNMTLPSAQTAGGVGLAPGVTPQMGGAPDAAQPPDAATPIRGMLRTIQSPEELRSYTKLPSEKQNEYQDTADARVESARVAAENKQNENDQKALDRIAQIKAAAAAKPVPDKLTKVEHKGADGKTIIEWLPESQLRGQTFDAPTNAATANRLSSAQAVQQTGNDIIAKLQDQKYSQNLGVAMGRFSNLQDFIGNPPPEYSELAGQIESYALASMGVHGMRSAQGAEKISKMLSQPHTPESLVGAIKGLNGFSQHFMENEGRGGSIAPAPTAPAAKPTAADLIKKYGG